MLVGSTGSGKEVFARAIHDHSNRVKGPFLALNLSLIHIYCVCIFEKIAICESMIIT